MILVKIQQVILAFPFISFSFGIFKDCMLLGTTLTKMYRYVILIDPTCNQVEVIVAKKYERMMFTHGIFTDFFLYWSVR